ncbi:MAG: histidine--tRNA ligase [Deltaproteobacteria bacterium]|nr:histidine--tRNA ligase [Deltaproteobacteria bacterium]
MSKLRSVKGMNDILPEETPRWHRLEAELRSVFERHGYGEVRTPIVEKTALFTRSIGEATDIVNKEMYSFVDKGDEALTLRPEGTASCARAFLQHSVGAKKPVNKWYYLGPMYRRERPARGRYRQFYQAGVECYGDPGPFVDAEMIDMSVSLLAALGITEVRVLLNSLGSDQTRARYRDALKEFFTPLAAELSPESQARLEQNPLRILDSKSPKDQELSQGAPPILDFLGDDDREHFDELRRALDALGTPYEVDTSLVRGLDYYTRTLFEVQTTSGSLGAQSALLGGGRYDGMLAELGGKATPAVGFAMGLERLLHMMPEEQAPPALDAFVVMAGAALRPEALRLAKALRAEGARVDVDLRGGSLKSQLRRVDKSGAAYALVLGEGELERGVVQLKDLARHEQEELTLEDAPQHLRGLITPS